MKKVLTILVLFFLTASCVREKKDIKGIWLDADFSKPHTIEFKDSLWFDDLYAVDSIPYFIDNDIIFVFGRYDSTLNKFSFHTSKDTFWISTSFDNQSNKTKYFRAKSEHYFNDIKLYSGIELDLPMGTSRLLDLFNCNSIYLPKQGASNGQYKITLNNERLSLDSLLHEKLFELKKKNDFVHQNIFALYIDSEIKYETVKLLKIELRKAGFYNIAYICDPSREKYYQSRIGIQRRLLPIFENEKYYINSSISKFVDSTNPPTPPKEFFEKPDYRKPNVCKIEIIENQIFLNDSIFDLNRLYEKLQKNNSLLIYLYLDKESDYQTYLTFISEYDSLSQKNRNEKSIELYQTEYDKLTDYEKKKNIRRITRSGLIEK